MGLAEVTVGVEDDGEGHSRVSGVGVAVEVLLACVGWRGSQGEAIVIAG